MGKELLFSLFGVLTASVRIHCKTNTNILFLLFFPNSLEENLEHILINHVGLCVLYFTGLILPMALWFLECYCFFSLGEIFIFLTFYFVLRYSQVTDTVVIVSGKQ